LPDIGPPDAPPLSWIADNGAKVCSFTVESVSPAGGIFVMLYDATGVRSCAPAIVPPSK
jgi:hypothetical protein